MNNFLTFHVEVTLDGVNIMYHGNNGMTERVEAVSHIDAVGHLDARDYDGKPDEGMLTHLATADGGNQEYFDHTSQHNVIMQRWLIITVFMLEMGEENGTVSIIDDTGNPSEVAVYSNGIVAMPLYSVAERLVMANNIKGAMMERFGTESGTECAIIFYRAIMDVEQGALTPFDRETLAELHNGFIAELNENGMPTEPVMH